MPSLTDELAPLEPGLVSEISLIFRLLVSYKLIWRYPTDSLQRDVLLAIGRSVKDISVSLNAIYTSISAVASALRKNS